jgi:hypothetical protein
MRLYIINLTNNLIRKHRYDDLANAFGREDFLRFVQLDLLSGDVSAMRPETLGKIMCSIHTKEIAGTNEELFQGTHLAGTCESMLRELVARFLAYTILERLQMNPRAGVVQFIPKSLEQ